jgi:hypothetical protein
MGSAGTLSRKGLTFQSVIQDGIAGGATFYQLVAEAHAGTIRVLANPRAICPGPIGEILGAYTMVLATGVRTDVTVVTTPGALGANEIRLNSRTEWEVGTTVPAGTILVMQVALAKSGIDY